MTRPENSSYKLEEKKVFKNGVIYEYWHDWVDNWHHIHLPDGMTIYVEHEDNEGSVEIEEATNQESRGGGRRYADDFRRKT